MLTRGRFSRGIDTEINSEKLYNYYSKSCPNFYFHLKAKLKKVLVYRSNYQNWWNEKELLNKNANFLQLILTEEIQIFLNKQNYLE